MQADLGVFRRPSLVRLTLAGLISGIGDWLLLIALPVYVYSTTRSTLSSSVTMLAELGAGLLAGQFTGMMVDRFDRRRLLVVGSALQAVCLLPLLAVHDRHDLWIIYAVSAVQSALGTLSGPAESALLPSLVDADELVSANTFVESGGELARLIGAAAGGVALAWEGLSGVVLTDAASFLAVVALLIVRFPIADQRPVGADPAMRLSSPWRAWMDGLAVVRASRELRATLVMILIHQLSQGIELSLLVAFIVTDLHHGSADVGVFRAVLVIGSLPTGLLLAIYGRGVAPERLLQVGLIFGTLFNFLIWNGPLFTTWFGYYLILQVGLGVPGVVGYVGFSAILQKRTPDAYRGRVFGLTGAVSSAALLISVLAGGALGETTDPRNILNIAVGLELITAVFALVTFRPRRTEVSLEPAG